MGAQMDPDLRTFLFKMLKLHMSAPRFNDDARAPYKGVDVLRIIKAAKTVLAQECTLLEMAPPIVIVGDIHGQFFDLLRMFNLFADDKNLCGALATKYLFLGDYVDRGTRSLECILLVFILKALFPTKIGLLRGNHECKQINKVYGFWEELHDRFSPEHADRIWFAFNDAFAHLPLAGLVGKQILCMHGGIGPSLTSLDDIRNIRRPLEEPMGHALAMDLMWADPMMNLTGFVPNNVRGVSVYFGEDTVAQLCNKLNLKLIVRAHQMMLQGYDFFCGRRLLTVFSAPRYYPEKNNKGAVLQVDSNGRLKIHMLVPVSDATKGEGNFRTVQNRNNEDHSGYQSWNGSEDKKKKKKKRQMDSVTMPPS